MIKFETINGTLCRMVEPTPLQLDSPMPCVVRYIQDCSPMGRYLKRKYAMVINTVAKVSRIGADGRAYSSDKSFVEEVEVLEIIGYPEAEGSKEWALWQAENGKSFEHKTAHHCRIFTMFSETELRVTNEEGEVVEFVDIDRFLSEGAKDGWQLYPPEPQFAVGDWVEFRDIEGIKHGIIEGRREEYNVLCNGVSQSVGDKFIIRKLNPSEIVLDFGNGIRGTIRRYRGEQIRIYDGDINFACLAISYVTEPMQTTVRKLLAAIEEERKKQ